eukprot:jgi/Botrbrau1/15874/Bobra.40_1s0058.1
MQDVSRWTPHSRQEGLHVKQLGFARVEEVRGTSGEVRFRGKFLGASVDQPRRLEADGKKRGDGCVEWNFLLEVPNEEQESVKLRLEKVMPFNDVCFAIDLPSKENAEPGQLLHAARDALRLLPLRVGCRDGTASKEAPADVALRKARDALAAELGTPAALLKQLTRELLQELRIEGVLSGVDVSIMGRIKSLHSTHRKMVRKHVPLEGVYDTLALRIVVDDSEGKERQAAVQACYRILPAVHRLWKAVPEEFDDYIIKPKPSGYQSLHTTVIVGNVALEVQVRTRSMHVAAESGKASHSYYKDSVALTSHIPQLPLASEDRKPKVGDSVVKISRRSELQAGVVIDVGSRERHRGRHRVRNRLKKKMKPQAPETDPSATEGAEPESTPGPDGSPRRKSTKCTAFLLL